MTHCSARIDLNQKIESLFLEALLLDKDENLREKDLQNLKDALLSCDDVR